MNSREQEIKFQKMQMERGVWRCCVNCVYFQERHRIDTQDEDGFMIEERQCTFNEVNVQPPMEVIVVGCNNHIQAVPF